MHPSQLYAPIKQMYPYPIALPRLPSPVRLPLSLVPFASSSSGPSLLPASVLAGGERGRDPHQPLDPVLLHLLV
jgi:hypothetical protein